jgi:SAM-dependent methyltransferase
MLAARAQFESGRWPSGWAAPPSQLQLQGLELQRGAAKRAQIALGNRATIRTADLRDAPLPEADVVVMIDVLHYLDTDAQISLLGRVARSLRGGGILVLRVADVSAGWRFHAGKAADRLGSLMTFGMPSHYHRPMDEWLHLLDDIGFESNLESGSPEKSFANVLVWAKARPLMKA